MSDIRLYLRYKMYCLKGYLVNRGKDFGKIKTWYYVFLLYSLVSIFSYIMFNLNIFHVITVWSISFFLMNLIAVLKDYNSGQHRFWNREKHREVIDNGIRTE